MKMSQIMAFTQRVEFKTLIEIECHGLTGFSPLVHTCLDEFKSMLSLFNSVDVLIIDEPEDTQIMKTLMSEVNERGEQFKKVFLLSDTQKNQEHVSVYPKNDLERLINDLKEYIHPEQNYQPDYISIPVESLVHFNIVPFDLFLKLGEQNYVKRIPAYEEIDENTFEGFRLKKISELHFEKRFNRDFSIMLINNMINKVEKEYDSLHDKFKATSEVYQTTHQIVSKLGFKPKVIEVCESVMNQISVDVASGKDNFSRYLELLRSQTALSFHYRLMELTCFIATQLIDEIEEGSKREKIRKIVFASMFCDYSLTDKKYVRIRHAGQMSELSQLEQKLVNEHALRASELVGQYHKAPYEASVIIKHHHGSLTGVGFPKEISPKILPLAKCLMAAQEISFAILDDSSRHPIDVLSDVKLKFIDTPLEEYFTLFEKTCQNNLGEEV